MTGTTTSLDDQEHDPNPQEATNENNHNQEEEAWSTQDPDLLDPSRIHGILEICATLSILGFFSFFGLLARLGLIAIGTYNGQSTFPVLWAQIVGCFFMGIFTSRKDLIEAMWVAHMMGFISILLLQSS